MLKYIQTGIFFVIVFFLTRQVPFNNYSIFMNVGVMLLTIISFVGINAESDVKVSPFTRNFTYLMILILGMHLIYSVAMTDNEKGNVFRFFTIIITLILCYHIKSIPSSYIKVFFGLMIFQAILLIIFECYFLLFLNPVQAQALRFFSLESGWGDIYSTGLFYKIQVKGNALLPVTYMLTFVKAYPLKKQRLYQIILLGGIVIAGNFAFLISICVFHLIYYFSTVRNNKQLYQRIFYLVILLAIAIIPAFNFVQKTLETKKDESLFLRQEQIKYLSEDLLSTPFTAIIGNGLGKTLEIVTPVRDYRGSVYFEIQPLYFLDQLGILFFTLFMAYNFYMAFINYTRSPLLLIYFSYWCYAISNPYILDTNQFVLVLILNGFQKIINEKENNERLCNHRFIQPG
jgi:hypothetical protein